MTLAPIVVFDSGVGGLSVWQQIRTLLPQLPVIYCADSAGFPYGPKPESRVIERTVDCVTRLVEQYNPSLVVIACNTASTVSLPTLRQRLTIPVVGVVPAIKTAALLSHTRRIGLLATPGTVVRPYTDQLIEDFAADCQVVRVGSSDLVQMTEDFLRGIEPNREQLAAIVVPFFDSEPLTDVIVNGCTHFPLLTEQLAAVSPASVRYVDSGAAVAARVASLLNLKADHKYLTGEAMFVSTGSTKDVEALKPALITFGFITFDLLNL